MMTDMENAVEKIKVWRRFVPREGWFPQDTVSLQKTAHQRSPFSPSWYPDQ